MLTKASRRWLIPLFLIAGLLLFTTPADAQSRGQTNGRKTKTEKKEATKSAASKANRSSGNRSNASGSRQRSNSAANRSSQASSAQNGSTSSRSQQRSRGNSTATSSNRAQNSNQSAGRSSRSGSNSSARTSSRTPRSSAGQSTSPSAGSSSTATRNSRGSSSTSTRRSTGNSRITDQSSSGRSARQGDSRNNDASSGRTSSSTQARDRNVSSNNDRRTGNSRTETGNRGRQTASSGRTNSSNRGTTTRQQNDRSRTVVTERNRTTQTRRDNTTVRIQPSRRNHGSSRQVYTRKQYKHRPTLHVKNPHYKKYNKHYNKHYYVSPVYYHRPHIQVNVTWPWQNRYYRKWKPHYRYKQVVYVNVGTHKKYRSARIDVRTDYHQEVRYADHRKAVVDIYLDRIEVYEDGYFYGEVYKIPDHLSHIEATIYRNGDVVYDKDVFLVGDTRAGFEMISTRNYDGYVLDYYERSHGYKVGKLNFRSKRVESRRYSRLFDPYGYNSYAPISLLPEDRYLADYGYDSVSYNYYDDDYDPYYGGSYDDDYYDYYDDGSYYRYDAPRNSTYGKSPNDQNYSKQTVDARIAASGPIKINNNQAFTTRAGLSVKYEREAQLERIR